MNPKKNFINLKFLNLLKKIYRLYKNEGLNGLNRTLNSKFKQFFSPNFIYDEISRIAINTIKNAYEEQAKTIAMACSYVYQMGIEGDIAEFGTDEAHTSVAIASSVFQMNKFQKKDPRGIKSIHYFDSFEGFPIIDNEVDKQSKLVKYGIWKKGTCNSYSEEAFKKKISQYLSCKFYITHRGWYKDTLQQIKDSQKFALIHVDCTLYGSAKEVFEYILRRKLISVGGIILIKSFRLYSDDNIAGEQKAFFEMTNKYKVNFEDLGDYGHFSKRFLIKKYE